MKVCTCGHGDHSHLLIGCVGGETCDCKKFQLDASSIVGLDFVTALRTGRPIRRRLWIAAGPTTDPVVQSHQALLLQHWWIYPRSAFNAQERDGGFTGSIFTNIATGRAQAVMLDDFLASDWESMP